MPSLLEESRTCAFDLSTGLLDNLGPKDSYLELAASDTEERGGGMLRPDG